MTDLQSRHEALRQAQPRLRIRDAATALGVSEAELVDLKVGTSAIRLDLAIDRQALVRGFKNVGRVMSLTRNDACVHERMGRFEAVSFRGPVGLVLGPDIDLRLFTGTWAHAYAVDVQSQGRTLRSIQIFDSHGQAVQKVYLQDEGGDPECWDALIDRFRAADQRAGRLVDVPARPVAQAPGSFDPEALLSGWSAMTDTHQFHGLLRTHGATAGQAFAAAEGRYTHRLPATISESLLLGASENAVSIMVFVSNPGCIQIHSGPVRRILRRGEWINVMDPDFNLHLHDGRVASAWAVSKPTEDGDVHSVELLDASDEVLVRFFGVRKPGQVEDPAWRALWDSLVMSRSAGEA
ncbi:MAG: ChuX/HutX family heme-like substrate-binding protein [Myxococcota bacterium]|nr:ChuX/HutX family heme-like substrate-binding protein [Myxococcota bacterium]MEC8424143.1 ChuX/HutX family heme-like substrate-binding protein [Myxococcota bacterium]